MPERSKSPKRTRKRGPNAKNGCATCKVRRKKCDETKPSCLQCMSTGRSCDFHQSLSDRKLRNGNYVDLSCRPRSLVIIPPEEIVHFDYFRVDCTREFSESFVDSLWKQLILQAMHAESFVLNAVLAIGALRRFQLKSEDLTVGRKATLEYSISKYDKATRELSTQLRTSMADWKLAVIGSIVFLAIDVLQGNETEAIVHFRSGSAILNTVSHSSCDMRFSGDLSKSSNHGSAYSRMGDYDILASAFTRLDVEEHTIRGSNAATMAVLPSLPTKFESITEARSSLNTIVAFVDSFLRYWGHDDLKTLPLHAIPQPVATELAQTQDILQSWHQSFNIFICKRRKKLAKDDFGAQVLLVHHLVTFIKLSIHFYGDQMIYDSYLGHFKHILDLTTTIVEADNASWSRLRGPCFTLDIAMVQPLYFVARRCRDPALRRRAIDTMKKVGKEGIYTGKTFAKVSEWIVGQEERNGFVDGIVSETSRYHDVELEFHQTARAVTISGINRNLNGSLVRVVERLDLLL